MSITYRPIATLDEMEACVALQIKVWGFKPVDAVPVPLLVIARKYGGFLYGAFQQNELIGFVYSLPGWGHTVRLQWSHMTAVDPRYQGHGIGYRLKQYQWEFARDHNYPLIAWTFDPLETRNAYFNFEKLGTIARFYEPNIYGITTGRLHHGLPTDRLIAEWWTTWQKPSLDPAEPRDLIDIKWFRHRPYPVKIHVPDEPSHRIPVPAPKQYPSSAPAWKRMRKAWQDAVREAFTSAFSAGYLALSFERSATANSLCSYILVHQDSLKTDVPAW